MKFGSQILDKSVPDWKLNNIDYEELKKIIKQVTSKKTAPNSNDFEGLEVSFKQNIVQINLFVSLKLKEISSKLVSIEHSITKLLDNEINDNRKVLRRIKTIKNYLETCNDLLQKLSRFVIVQRIALRKLFKKITKHYGDKKIAQQFISSIQNCNELRDGYEGVSFKNLDLQSYLVEVSLIMDILTDMTNAIKSTGNFKDLPSELFEKSKLITNATDNKKPLVSFTTNQQFDQVLWDKGELIQSLLVRSDNNEQLKFLLITLGFQVFDQNLQGISRDIIASEPNSEVRSLRSKKSFYESDRPALKRLHTSSTEYLNNAEEMEQSKCKAVMLTPSGKVDSSIYDSKKITSYPSVLLEYEKNNVIANECIVICHVGGLRGKVVTDKLHINEISEYLKNSNKQAISDPLAKIALDWICDHGMKECGIEIGFKRTRYFCNKHSNLYMITIDEEFTLSDSNGQTEKLMDHSIIDLRVVTTNFSSDNKSLAKKSQEIYEKIISSKIQCFPFQPDFHPVKLLLSIHENNGSKDVIHRLMLENIYELNENNKITEDEFFGIGFDLLLDICSSEFKDNYYQKVESPTRTPNDWKKNNLLSKNKNTENNKPAIRYWNEFDDLEEENGGGGFYIQDRTDDLESNELQQERDYGFIHFSKDFIESTYSSLQSFRDFLGFKDNNRTAIDPALLDLSERFGNSNYGSISSKGSILSNSVDDIRKLIEHQMKEIENSESVYVYKHDQVLSLMYLFALLMACATSGICMGIVLSVFNGDNSDIEIDVGKTLIITVILSLGISLGLITLCLLLLFSRYTYAPIWHYALSFAIFIMIMSTVCYGLVEIFL